MNRIAVLVGMLAVIAASSFFAATTAFAVDTTPPIASIASTQVNQALTNGGPGIVTGDVNGDGKDDLIVRVGNDLRVALNNGNYGFATYATWSTVTVASTSKLMIADVNADGLDDAVFSETTTPGSWRACISSGTAFAACAVWGPGLPSTATSMLGNVDGANSGADAIGITRNNNMDTWTAALVNGNRTAFGAKSNWGTVTSATATDRVLADVTGDGKADSVTYDPWANAFIVKPSTGTAFGTASNWAVPSQWFSPWKLYSGNFDGDNKQDLYFARSWSPTQSAWTVYRSNGAGVDAAYQNLYGPGGDELLVADINGDGKDDVGSYEYSSNRVRFAVSTGTAINTLKTSFGTNTPTFDFQANEPSTFECRVASTDAWQVCPQLYTTPVQTDGPHTLNYRAKDLAGNYSYDWIVNYTVDTTPPVASITSGPANGSMTSSTAASFGFSANESATFECKLDNATFVACTSPKAYAGLAVGSHSFSVRARDLMGYYSAVVTNTFTVDTTPPVVTVTAPTGLASVMTVRFTATDANGISSRTCSIDGGAPFACVTGQALTGVAPGSHTITVTAKDPANNTGTGVSSFIYDNVPPAVSGIAPNGPISTPNPLVTFNATDANGIRNTVCQFDYQSAYSCSNGATVPASLADGAHILTLYVYDNAGNPTVVEQNFSVDATPPSVYINNPSVKVWTHTPDLSFDTSEAISGSATCAIDGAAAFSCASGQTLASLADGTHTLTVTVHDLVNNVGTSTSSFVVDTTDHTPPVVTVTAPTGTVATHKPTLTFGATDANGVGSSSCTVNGGPAFYCASGQALPYLADGTYTVIVSTPDPAGNVGTGSIGFTVSAGPDLTPPTAPTSFYVSGQTDTSAVFNWSGATDDAGIASYDIYINGNWVDWSLNSPHTVTGLSCGTTYTGYVVVLDTSNNYAVGPTRTFKTTPCPGTAPTVTITSLTPNMSVPYASFDIWYEVYGSPTTTVACLLDGAPLSSCWINEAFVGGLADGLHTLSVTATNSFGSGTSSVSFTVDTVIPETSITSGPADGSAVGTTTPQFGFSSSEPGSTFECSVDSGSFAACTSPKTTSTLSIGSHTFAVRAIDAAGNVDASPANRSFTVTGPDTTPPTAPTNVAVSQITGTSANVTWTAATDNIGINSYDIYKNGNWIDWTPPSPTSYKMTNLTCGTTYSTKVVALDAAGNLATSSTVSFTTLACVAPISINFQPSGTAPSGYVADTGSTYGARGSGLSYGWSQDETANTRTRTGTGTTDARYNTLITLTYTTSASWKISVPNGVYSVHLVAGDATYPGADVFNVNGVSFINGTTTASVKWLEKTDVVTVTDGFITVTQPSGSANAIDYIDIIQQ